MATSAGSIPITATFSGTQLEKDVLSALTRIQSKSTLNLNTRNFTQPLGKITGLANEFNKSLEASNARVVAFGASAGVIFAVQKSFSALVNTTIDVEKSLTDINIVLNTSSKGIKQFGDQLFEVAKNTGSSFKDAAGAATEFSRQGLGLEETLRRTRDALILTRLSGLDVVSSTEALTAAVNSFTKEALTTTDVVNKLAAVDAKFAVSSRDLSEAIQRVGSSASEAGVSFDELLGIVTSVQQTTARGGAVIGNALKTIFTRIERPQVIDDLKDFGIAVNDISGNALPTIKIIENLAQSFQNLNPVVKSQVAELVGGVYQINILKAALADVSKQNSAFAEATKASSQAVDDAIVKNDALNQSLSALFNATTANFAKFAVSIGESSVAPGIRKVLEYVNSALESYNEKDSESIGKKIATGLLTGITSFVTGPGLALGALAVGKLIGNFASFAGDATKNILGLNSLGRQQAVLQGEISNILSSNPQLIQQIIAGSKSRLQVEKEIKQTLIEQAAVSEMLKKSSASIAYGYVASGLGISTSGAITGKKSAGGYIPAQQQASEMAGAMQGGYAPGKVVAAPKSIGGVMNTAEKVKYIPGFAQPYILPPDGSRAARNLTAKSMSQNGIDPYKARGFVPNFAPRSLDNNGRYADSDWWYGSELKAPVSLSQIQTGTAAAWSEEKGFYRTDGKNFTANDLNTFIRRGATYGKIRESLQKIPDSFFQDDPRYKAGASKEQLIREFRPGSKTSTVESVKEEAKRIFEPYTPPASMLIWDLARKNNDQDEVVDLEKLTNDKTQAGRQFKIKIRALSASPLNEEKFGLIDQTSKFARNITKKLAIGIPGAKSDYSDEEVDSYFDKTGKNYNVLAGTIFEAGTNLAASYVRDKEFNKGAAKLSAIGGDFDVKGGANLANVQKFFPGFTDSYGDYKLNNSYDAIREFIDKVQKEFPLQIGRHFNEQESKIAGITTSSQGFIPNFAQKDFQTVNTARLMGINLAQMDINPETVFRESLQNAIAHGQSGREKGVFIGAGRYGEPSQFAISDVGAGMSPEDVFTKFLPYAQTGNEGGNKGLSGFGMGKASIFMGSKKFLLDTIKEINGKKIRTIVSGTPEGWNNFIQKGKISLDENLFNQPRGDLNLDGLKMFWREIDPEKKNTPTRGTTFAASPSKQDYVNYLRYASQRTGKVAEIPFNFSTLPSSNLPRQMMRPRTGDDAFKKYHLSKFESNKSSVQSTLKAQGGEVDLLFDAQGEPEETYGTARIPMLSEGMRYADYQVDGVDYIPRNLMFNVRSNVGASDPDYPWNTDRTELRGPLGKMAKSAVQDLAAQLKRIQQESVRNVPSYKMGSGLEFLDVSSSLPREKMESIAGNAKFQNFGAALKSVFEQTIGQASEIFDPAMASASFRGLAVGANWMGLNTGSHKEGVGGTSSVVEPFAHIETVIKRIKKISEEKAKQGKKVKSIGKFRDIYSREILDTVVHEAAHQVNRTEGEAHAKSMASVWAANAEQVGGYLKQIQGSLDPELMNFIISTYKENKSVIDEGKAEKFKSFLSKSSSGHVPNFLKPKIKSFKTGEGERVLGPAAIVNKQTKEDFIKKVLEGEQDKSYIRYSKKDNSLDVDFVNSSRRGDGGKLWDRAGEIAKRLNVPLTTSAFLFQKKNLEKYDAETGSFGDVLATGFPQLKWSERGKAKNTKLNIYNNHSQYPVESKRTFSEAQSLLNNIYKYDAPSLKDSILSESTYIKDIISYFAKGHVPNFNAVQEAIGREMSAGYSSSQVKVGQSSKLKTNFNPMGLGVYNSTEGSLNGGIGLAEKAGINPKTKGMSARGHIPNFAEFGGVDFSIAIGALALFATSIKSSMDSFNNLKKGIEDTKKTNTNAAKTYEAELKRGSGTIAKEFAAREKLIQDEIKKTFTNVNAKLKLTGTSTGPLVHGPYAMDPLTHKLSRSPVAASADEVARLAELREQRAANKKEKLAQQEAARKGKAEAEGNLSLASANVLDPKTMFKSNSKFSNNARAIGTPIGLAASAVSNIGGQFVSPENKTGKAYASGIGDVASFAGLGAQFGAPGVIVGAVIGIGSMLVKLKDAKAEEAIDKINRSLDETKQKSSDFSGAAQNYATSLEGLQSALNDPKTKPQALLKFQNNITEALSSIPDEFRNKVLQAGTDITKYSEAIAGINKELGNTQKNLERQLAITNLIKDESSIFGNASVSAKNQKTLNALFSSSVNPESVTKNFQGGSATTDLNTFFENLKKETTYIRDVHSPSGGMTASVKIGEVSDLDKNSVESVKSKLKDKGLLSGVIADLLDDAFGKLDLAAVTSIINAIQKQGSAIIDNAKRAKILNEILDVNTKRIIANAEALKVLNEQFNDINLQISNQIDIEKNRGKTIREINKIQAEGVVSTQRARVKGALDAFSPFVGEGTKNNIQNQLDTNEINTRQNSQIRDATSKLLDSLSDSITKKVEEARGKIVPAIEGATGTDNIQKQRAVFQRQIDLLTPVVTKGLKGINETGNVSDTRGSLTKIIQENAGVNKAFTKEASELLIQSLDVSFSEFQNKLGEIKAQNDIDLDIQKASREYQKQSLALNQRLSFAGGAQALGSTGKAGVSDLFDSLSELVSEFRKTNAIGSAAQKGSTSFKFLDILTNQLQLNRATEAPAGFADAQSFNKQVSSDLNPLTAIAIAGRVQQTRDSLNLAKDLAEIQTGKSTEGTALGAAFDMAKEGAVQTALDQIASQFKLENMGNYLDVLQQEARYLNDLTRKQNELLASALPTSINNNFKEVIESKVGVRLDTLTSSLTGIISKLANSTKRSTVDTDIANLLPSDIPPAKRAALLKRIQDSGNLIPTPLTTPTTAGQTGVDELKKKNQEELDKYRDALAAVQKDKERMSSGNSSVEGEEAIQYINQIRAKYNTDRKSGELSIKEVQSRQSEVEASQQSYVNNRTNQVDFNNLSGTYKEFVDKANQDFGTSITEETVKSIQPLLAERRKLDQRDAIPPPPPFPSDFPDFPKKPNKNVLIENIPTELAKGRAALDSGREATKARNAEQLITLNKEVEGLLAQKNKNTEQEARLLKKQIELREKGLQVENDNAEYNFDLFYKRGLGDKSFKDERAAFANARIESNARQGNVDIEAITEKNTTYNRADFARDTGQLIDTFQTDFKSGIGSAFGEAIKGTKTLKDAFRDMFQGILNRMLDKSLEMGVDALFAFGKAATTGRKDGGLIRGYNSGGMVTGGSGMKDDVPAMMSGGEYVIKKSSVDKYGTDYLRNLNGGAIPRYATGGFSVGPLQNEFLYDNPDRPTSGEFAVDSRLSAMALTDENNPQNKLREDRYEKLDQYLQDRAQYEADKKQSLKNYKNQVNSTFYSGLTSAAIQLGTAGLTMGAEKLRTQGYAGTTAGRLESGVGTSPEMMTVSNGRATMPRRRAFGGFIAKFAGGGSTGQDNIPALLMGGEYVMNKKAVDMYGKDFMGQLNSGSLPKYANGGMVGTSYNGQSNTDQSSSMDELVTALNALNDNLSKDSGITQSESGRTSAAGATQESGMSVVNNISINMSQGGEVTSEANSSTQKGASNSKNDQNSMQNNSKLAELLRSKVVEVLVEQKRPGGLLYASR